MTHEPLPEASAPQVVSHRVKTLDLKAVLAMRRAQESAQAAASLRESNEEQERHSAMRELASARLLASTNVSHRPKLLDALVRMIRIGRNNDPVRVAALKQEAKRLERQLA